MRGCRLSVTGKRDADGVNMGADAGLQLLMGTWRWVISHR